MAETLLDTRGLKCPLPVLRARKAMQSAGAGRRAPGARDRSRHGQDFRAFCQATGHELVEQAEQAGEFSFRIRKAR